MTTSAQPRPPLAIVGVSAIFPGSSDEQGFWRDILAGRDLIRDIPPGHWRIDDYYDPDPAAPDKTYARRGAFLDAMPFDALAFGVPPSIAPATDTSQLLALIAAQRVLDDATAGQFAGIDKSRVSVILGVTSGQELLSSMVSRLQRPVWVKSLREAGLPESQVQTICDRIASHYVGWQEATFPGLLGNVVAGRIANRFDLGGTNCVTDAACASTFSALAMASSELYLGQSDLVITGGVDTLNDIFMFMCFSKTPALSPSGDCRPFAEQADGTMLGEGLGMVALKRLADAEAAGDRVYALVRGVGTSSDGRAMSVYAPRPQGQAAAIARAYQAAGFEPSTIELIEAHGTGTRAGDVAELEGLECVFADGAARPRAWCALGSIKSQIGHAKAAAGAAGLFKAVMALHHGVLPPTIKVDTPSPALDAGRSPFYLNTRARPWVRGSDHPRRAGVSAFGFGGSNFHLALEEYRGPAPRALRLRVTPSELVVLAAATPQALLVRLDALDLSGDGYLPWLARHAAETEPRDGLARLAIVASDVEDLRTKLGAARVAIATAPDRSTALPGGVHYGVGARQGDLAFLFPGQGSQYLEMGADLARCWPQALATWDGAADLALDDTCALHEVVFPPPSFDAAVRSAQDRRLRQTEWAQPALAVCEQSYLALLRAAGLQPDLVAGHSFGEIMALQAAGVFDATTAIRIARRRGELMAEAARQPGAMVAALAPLDRVRAAIAGVDGVVVANHNAPEQIVLSGPVAAVERAEAALTAQNIAHERLPVATAFHSPVVATSRPAFRAFLDDVPLSTPVRPVFANASAAPYADSAEAMRELLAAQLVSPVLFVEQVEAMYAAGARTFVEVGPGAVLSGLVERILHGRSFTAVPLDARGKPGATALHEGLARLFAAGWVLNLGALWKDFRRCTDPRAARAPAHALMISGTNFGKPYPSADGSPCMPPPNPEPQPPARESAAEAPESAGSVPSVVTAAPVAHELALQPPDGVVTAASASPEWLAAYQQVQHDTALAHMAWQSTMTQAHQAYLQTVETSFATMAGATTRAEGVGTPSLPRSSAAQSSPLPLPTATALTPVALPTPAPLMARAPQQAPVFASPAPAPAAPLSAAPTTPPPRPAVQDLGAILLEVVADKTGYPADMLGMDMGLEADLGIDSIKRVEILAAMRTRVPDLPQVKPAQLAKLKTLGAILTFMKQRGETQAAAPATPATEPPPSTSADGVPASGSRAALARAVVQAEPRPAPGFVTPGLIAAKRLVVVDEGAGFAPAMVAALAGRGCPAEVVTEVPVDADAVLHLGGLQVDASPQAARRAVQAVFATARALAGTMRERGGLLVTVQDTGGDLGLGGSPRAWLAGIAGITKTAAREWPLACVRALDVEVGGRDPGSVARVVVDEMLEGGAELEVGLAADGQRRVPRSLPCPIDGQPGVTLDADSVVLVAGGARGVTAACTLALAGACSPRLVLLGRTPLHDEPAAFRAASDAATVQQVLLQQARDRGTPLSPVELRAQVRHILDCREVRATLQALQAAGAHVRYLALDLRDRSSLRQALATVRADWGPISVVIHGAGVLADRWLADKTDADFEAVYSTKVDALHALLDATAADPLRGLFLFSSAAARTGNAGQSDYAAANEVLNKVAALEAARRPGCVVRALGWGPWGGGMVTLALQQHFTAAGVSLIALRDGAAAFVDEVLRAGRRAPVVLLGGELVATEGPEACASARYDFAVHVSTHPYLAAHCIDGVPVLPVVLVLEWFVRVARALHPELEVLGCHDLRVLRGIRLRHFDDAVEILTVVVTSVARNDARSLRLQLCNADGTACYSARVELAHARPAAAAVPAAPARLEPFGGSMYGGALFHGPAFQVLRSVDGVSSDGAVATLVGTRDRGWRGAWCIDAAALDGGLQLALLWSAHLQGGRALPTGVAAFRSYAAGTSTGLLQCRLFRRAVDENGAVCDLVLVDAAGALVAELSGVQLYRRPDPASLEVPQ